MTTIPAHLIQECQIEAACFGKAMEKLGALTYQTLGYTEDKELELIAEGYAEAYWRTDGTEQLCADEVRDAAGEDDLHTIARRYFLRGFNAAFAAQHREAS